MNAIDSKSNANNAGTLTASKKIKPISVAVLEALETRQLYSVSPSAVCGHFSTGVTVHGSASATPAARSSSQDAKQLRTDTQHQPVHKSATQYILNHAASKLLSAGPDVGFTPQQIKQAYGLNQLDLNGAGQTIAIVDAFNDPNIQRDLQTYDQAFGIQAPPSFRQVGENGSSKLPANNNGWSGEISLDVEWAHALAPDAGILLVEANNSSDSNLNAAVNFAKKQTGVAVVSMSYGGPGGQADDAIYTTPAGHQGVTFVQSSGDDGAPGSYISSNVVAVGGTSLFTDSNGNYSSEAGWDGSGGGTVQGEPEPVYQKRAQSTGKRTSPDVSFDADPDTGVSIFDSTSGGWSDIGGTSLSAPAWAAIMALVDQHRAGAGLGSLDGATQTLPALYSLPSTDFHDITTGDNGDSTTVGYDLVTGLGTPVAENLVPDLARYSAGSSTPTPAPTPTPVPTPVPTTVVGTTITGFLGVENASFADGSIADVYTFKATHRGAAQISMSSTSFAPSLTVYQLTSTGSPRTVATNNNASGGANAAVRFTVKKGAKYVLLAGSSLNSSGSYGLSLSSNIASVTAINAN